MRRVVDVGILGESKILYDNLDRVSKINFYLPSLSGGDDGQRTIINSVIGLDLDSLIRLWDPVYGILPMLHGFPKVEVEILCLTRFKRLYILTSFIE